MRKSLRSGSRSPLGDLRQSRRTLVQRAAAMGLGACATPLLPQAALGQAETPAVATPSTQATRSITRDEYLDDIRQFFPIAEPRVPGGHVLMAIDSEPRTFNPLIVSDFYSGMVLANVFSSLARPSAIDGGWVPDLADYWDVSAEGTVYVFHLNHNARWHDGQPVTAHDCVFTLDAVLDDQSLTSFRSDVVLAVKSYRAIDDHTFELVATQPIAYMLDKSVGGLSILPKHLWERIPLDEWGTAPGTTGADPSMVVGSGPFRFGEWVRGGHVSIVRNHNYWAPDLVPSIDRFTWRTLSDTDATLLALQAGEADICLVPVGQYAALHERHPELVYIIFDDSGWANFPMNGDPKLCPFFHDATVRQAMLFALDRDLIVETLLNGIGVRADGIYPPSSIAYAPERMTTIYDHDPDRARSLLDAAGWIDADGDGVREKDGITFRAEIIYPEAGTSTRQIVTYLQQAWREIGVNVQPVATPLPTLREREGTGEFALALDRWGGSGEDLGLLYRCDAFPPNGLNMARICNPQFDRLNDASLVELDATKRRELLIEQSDAAHQVAHFGWLYFSRSIVAHQPRVKNYFVNTPFILSMLPWIWVAEEDA